MSSHDASRILIIGPAQSLALEQWVREMKSRGHEIRVMSPERPREAIAHLRSSTESGPRVPGLRFVSRIRAIKRAIRAFEPDVVHGHSAFNYGLWATLAGFPRTLVTCWGSDVLIAPSLSATNRRKVRQALRRASYVTATSRTLLAAAESVAGRPLRGEVLHWGVDTDVFTPVSREPREHLTLLSLRAHKPLYNIDVILRAFARVHSDHGHVRLVVGHQGDETARLEQLASDLGVADAVNFIGWVAEADLPGLYRSADVYISVPDSDGSAVSNLEAMASGLAVVASDLPSTREWVEPGVSGVLVPARDESALVSALTDLVTDAPLRARLGAGARQVAESRGSRREQMDRASRLYDELAEGALP
ncbi:MAG: glycosyltransferase family 4 protein [Coriobacteriia bacterium]|nr:glycosyltransferase family 4 protein [Coriobacteriia bacterium]